MITVVADDLTGAAEIAGVAWRYGLSAELCFGAAAAQADVVCLDTESREMPSEQAACAVATACAHVAGPVYKKTDSVLRGSVVAEIRAVQRALDIPQALLVPANPALGRTIEGGSYHVDGRPVHLTEFRNDPSHAIHSSRVEDMLALPGVPVLPPGSRMPEHADIAVGEARSSADLERWAASLSPRVLPCGAAEFFAAILRGEGRSAVRSAPRLELSGALVVSGTASQGARKRLRSMAQREVEVLAVDPEHPGLAVLARRTAERVSRGDLRHVLIEGGSTAAAVFRELGWDRFSPECEYGPGVVRLRTPNPRLSVTLKPGSYCWPEFVRAEKGALP